MTDAKVSAIIGHMAKSMVPMGKGWSSRLIVRE